MWFEKFVTAVRTQPESEFFTQQDRLFLLSKLSETRIFLLMPPEKELDPPIQVNNLPEIEQLDLPFSLCWFENKDTRRMLAKYSDQYGEIYILGEFIIELAPKIYISYSLCEYSTTGELLIGKVGSGQDLTMARETHSQTLKMINTFLDRLKTNKAISIDSKKEIKYKDHTGKKVKTRLKPFIYIGSESQLSEYITTSGIDKSQCDYRFEVRGHWRRLEKPEAIGKDREGARVVKGYTWITPYIKGDKDLPLVRKARIVKG